MDRMARTYRVVEIKFPQSWDQTIQLLRRSASHQNYKRAMIYDDVLFGKP